MLIEDEDETLADKELKLNRDIFDVSVKIKRLLQSQPTSVPVKSGMKLPKLDVPKFDGNIIHWRTFWEQFSVSVHSRDALSNAEKLTYLRHALNDGKAKAVVEGLSSSGDQYQEAIDCLKKRFDRPRLIHQAHVSAIMEAPALKHGNGKELRKLHDTVNQHLRALKSMDCEPSGKFITSVLELKLDSKTTFEWQQHSQDSMQVPHFLSY